MSKFSTWLRAARLRTLPLSISGVVVGTALANFYGQSDNIIFVLALMTTIGFQVTSNFANDYGDGVKGTDNDFRLGPQRVLQSGLLTRKELKTGIMVSIGINLLLILGVLYFAFGTQNLAYFALFVVLGLASIWAAIRYTVGNSAYGYKGLGDIFVFLFFGLLAVVGTLFLYTKQFSWPALLPACTIGLLSTGVLNLNNLRDFENDKKSGKNTLVVKMGFNYGKFYHFGLILTAFICMLVFVVVNHSVVAQFLPLLAFVPIAIHMMKVNHTKAPEKLDPELKKLALSTFLMSVFFYIVFNNFL
ncbi:1,4-dihydroxy-2-naphthoate octaprenyltransferase [Maribacter halichondriae]|uniref:1,4-dihydroxy-2-naphthoate octaprenyltransferase n=1 Tax=Maribacter halichondriae TaxID=2980554 RepID=UPI00235A3BC1|nr:1,4-dihydroxy-2-naphthoate octaprenyltransferase [Maribacter sp. Hal144]